MFAFIFILGITGYVNAKVFFPQISTGQIIQSRANDAGSIMELSLGSYQFIFKIGLILVISNHYNLIYIFKGNVKI